MAFFDQLFTNIFWDGEVAGSNPDATKDYYQLTDFQKDRLYFENNIVDILRSISFDPTKEFFILFGGEVTDGGSGTINIAEAVCIGKDSNGLRKIIHLPALTGLSLPSGWDNNRQIWIKLKHDFKLGTLTRAHFNGETYHHQLLDTYLGDLNGYEFGTNDLFADSDPGDTVAILGSFTMNGTTFTDMKDGERTREFVPFSLSENVSADKNLSVNRIYYVNGSSSLNLTLPAYSSVGDIIEIVDIGGCGYKVKQNAGQNILFYGPSTIPGVVGYYKNNGRYSSIKLICTVANVTWQTIGTIYNFCARGYIAGGTTGSPITVIESLDMDFEIDRVLVATLNSARTNASGVSGQFKGYIIGGGVTGTPTAVIEDMNFSNESSSAIVATLDTVRAMGCGVQGPAKGYLMGGIGTTVIEDMNFSDESSSTISETLGAVKYGQVGVSGASKGYCIGGYTTDYSVTIEDMNFSDESSSAIVAVLNEGKFAGAGVYDLTKGYVMGGPTQTGNNNTKIERLNFSDESVSMMTATLDVTKADVCSVSGRKKGYALGGRNATTYYFDIEDFIFLNETSKTIIGALSTNKSASAGMQGYTG